MRLMHGDCYWQLQTLPDNSIDSLVTDPPAGISFMGKVWDSDKGGRDGWIAWLSDVMRECHRVLKPGAHGLVWAIPRTSHWTMTALENAGFEIRDVVTHLFGTGFPKSLDVSKAIDKEAGAKRQIIGKAIPGKTFSEAPPDSTGSHIWSGNLTARDGVTDAAKQWQGFGTALKPACEFWILVRKPCSEKTVAKNVLKWGTGALNIDGCRIGTAGGGGGNGLGSYLHGSSNGQGGQIPGLKHGAPSEPMGRFPANLVLDEDAAEALDEQSGITKSTGGKGAATQKATLSFGGGERVGGYEPKLRANAGGLGDSGGASRFFKCFSDRCACDIKTAWLDQNDSKNAQHVSASFRRDEPRLYSVLKAVKTNCKSDRLLRQCLDSMPDYKRCSLFRDLALHAADPLSIDTTEIIQSLLKLSGFARPATDGNTNSENRKEKSDQTRFLYCPKASKSDRGEDNKHPTVKSTKLMIYLCKLVTPPGGRVLDPFMGSGSTGVAAVKGKFRFVGIEQNREYFRTSRNRIRGISA